MNRHGSFAQQGSVRRKSALSPSAAISSLRLPDLRFFERGLGGDFSQVRVHTDARSAALAGALGAKAFASGNDIVFAEGRYRPDTSDGRELLAHELAHVAQQQRGGSDGAAQAEPRARAAAQTVASGGQVSGESLGGAAEGVHCDPDDNKKKKRNKESLFPDMEHLTLTTPSPIDWLKMRQHYDSRGVHMGEREVDDATDAWRRGSEQLDMLGIDDNFKFWFITKNWILNKGVSLQIENQMTRDNPNRIDYLNRDWSQTTGASQTPFVPVFDIDWFRSSKKKKRR